MGPGAGDQTCSILLVDCPEIEENLQFVSGQKECNYGDVGYMAIVRIFCQIKSFRRFRLAFGFGLQTFYLINFS